MVGWRLVGERWARAGLGLVEVGVGGVGWADVGGGWVEGSQGEGAGGCSTGQY